MYENDLADFGQLLDNVILGVVERYASNHRSRSPKTFGYLLNHLPMRKSIFILSQA